MKIWREPEERQPTTRDAIKNDPTAAARSSIRRRPSVHGRNGTRPRLARDSTVRVPRHETSRRYHFSSASGRESAGAGVPPISTLLESADRHRDALPPPPPALPETRSLYEEEDATMEYRRSRLEGAISRLQETAASLERQTAEMRTRMQDRLHGHRQRTQSNDTDRRPLRERRELPPPREMPESMRQALRERAQRDTQAGTVTLPSPPLDAAEADSDSLFIPERRNLRAHPLRNSWSPGSPVDGLGDRNRSPTPADGWEIIRTTITPDATLPSAESSFTSAAASQSFTSAPSGGTNDTEQASSSSVSRRNSSDESEQTDSVSSVDPDDLVCDEDDPAGAASMAEYIFEHEMVSPEGRARIRAMDAARDREGNRFALADEPASLDIGFRLIEEALETREGRERLIRVGVLTHTDGAGESEHAVSVQRRRRALLDREATVIDEAPPAPRPDRYGAESLSAVSEASARVHSYFRRHRSPPPSYSPSLPLASHPDVETFVSREEPEAHPVSPPADARHGNEGADAMLSGDETDLAAMRRVVERLARRDDVPEDWWHSIGLNLSRTRVRERSPWRDEVVGGDRVRGGRVERRGSRL